MATEKPFQQVLEELTSRARVTVGPGWGKGHVVAKLAGKMFALLVNGDLVVKLPKARVDSLVQDHVGTRFDPRRNGKVMKEWVVIPEGAADWVALAIESLEFMTKSRG
ncbi:MAG: hypothetical protein Q8N23_13650 [Archangium sp.]|nr:hypothetical protein [Archangium sp.]MDP3153717.1 hypothetical protein [Archangium sp.]MDP3569234.1 hypothetical protein [Archangium sp.]